MTRKKTFKFDYFTFWIIFFSKSYIEITIRVTSFSSISNCLVFVWSQYDIEQKKIGLGSLQNQKDQLKNVGGDFIWILPTPFTI